MNDLKEVLFINHGNRVEVELDEEKVYEGTLDICNIIRALGFSVEEIYVPLEFTSTDDEEDIFDELIQGFWRIIYRGVAQLSNQRKESLNCKKIRSKIQRKSDQ